MNQLKKLLITTSILVGYCSIVPSSIYAKDAEYPYQNSSLSDDERAKDLAARFTLEEKVAFVTGNKNEKEGVIGSYGVPRLGVPNFKIEHGPFGFKGWYRGGEPKEVGTYFPVSIAQAATWDCDLVERVNAAMGAEMKSSGGQANAGPAMNIIRDPRGGRSFEYFTEDPYLNGEIATAYVKGLQSQKVMANLKHYACNNQEFNRHTVSVNVDERTLREIYLPGFRAAIQKGGAWSVMGAYNKINGVYCCEDPFILTEVLRKDWGFNGFVLSDWAGTHSTAASVNAGMDLEMPNEKWYGKKLLAAVKSGEVKEEQVTRMVENILRGMFWAEAFDTKPTLDKSVLEQPSHLALAREAAAKSIVLLKNDNSTLPLDSKKIKSIAVIGPNGNYGKHYNGGKYDIKLLQGGGSASVDKKRTSMVTTFDALKADSKEAGFSVEYAPGCYAETGCGEIDSKFLKSKDGKEGLTVSYYQGMKFEGEPRKTSVEQRFSYMWRAALPIPEAGNKEGDSRRFAVAWEGTITAPATRDFIFEARNMSGSAKIYINGELIASNEKGNRLDYFAQGTISMKKGESYDIRAEYIKTGGLADFRLGWDYENDQMMREAIALAKRSDVVVMSVGLSGDMGETEAGDRNTLKLAPTQERLINEIAKVNKNVVVSIVAGSAIGVQNWADNVSSLLMCWYPGQQGGYGLADVLFGRINPSAKLPITFPESLSQYPDDFHSRGTAVEYKEGVFVGYRYFDKEQKSVLYPFGYGLSYTTFEYSNLKAKVLENNRVRVTLRVTNSGKYDGVEIVQLYVGDKESSEPRPLKELKSFQRVEIKSGKSRDVEFILDSEAFAFWSTSSRNWVVESGDFEISVGGSSDNLPVMTTVKIK